MSNAQKVHITDKDKYTEEEVALETWKQKSREASWVLVRLCAYHEMSVVRNGILWWKPAGFPHYSHSEPFPLLMI
jgi:hypothetical protein